MFSLRAGRAWLSNPAYQRSMEQHHFEGREPTSRFSEEMDVLDVLTVSVDGINLVADIRESPLFQVVSDVARAAETLARGNKRASLPFGSPPTELLLHRRGTEILVSLVVLGPPPEVRLDGFALDCETFFEAIQEFIEGFLSDILEVSPKLGRGPFVSSLAAKARRLRGRSRQRLHSRRPSRKWEKQIDTGGAAVFGEMTCTFELSRSSDRVFEWDGGAPGDLHSLLGNGHVSLRGSRNELIAKWNGPPYLAFRCLVFELRDFLSALEGGDCQASLHLGSTRLTFYFASGLLESPRGKWSTRPIQLAVVILQATLDFFDTVSRLAPMQRSNSYLSELAEDAGHLKEYCLALLEGDRIGPRPHDKASTVGPAPTTVSKEKLCAHKLRRVSMKSLWTFDVGPLVPGGFGFLGRGLLVAGEEGAFNLETESGRPSWVREGVGNVWRGPRRSDPVLMSTPVGLDLVTPVGKTAWSAVALEAGASNSELYLRGAGNLLFCPDDRSILALCETDGRIQWRFVPPHSSLCHVSGGRAGVLVASNSGFLFALNADTGKPRWRARTRMEPVSEPFSVGGKVHVMGDSAEGPVLFRTDTATGSSTERRVLAMDRAGRAIHTGGRAVIPGILGNVSVVVISTPGGGDRRVVLESFRGVPSVLATRSRIYVADRHGNLAALGRRGRLLWTSRIPCPEPHPETRPALCAGRGVLLVASQALYLVDLQDGSLLGSLTPESMHEIEQVLTNKHLTTFLVDPEGTVQATRIATHLSIV